MRVAATTTALKAINWVLLYVLYAGHHIIALEMQPDIRTPTKIACEYPLRAIASSFALRTSATQAGILVTLEIELDRV